MEKKTTKKKAVKETKKAVKKEIKNKVVKKEEPKKVETKKKKSSGTKFLCLFVVVVAFTFAFILLIRAQQKDTYYANMKGNSFSIKPVYGKTIVAKDMKAIYPKYYVAYINDDEFSLYVFNYYKTTDQYEMAFNELIDKIVDYNAKDKMIRYLHSRGYGSYEEVLGNLSSIVESDDLLIY